MILHGDTAFLHQSRRRFGQASGDQMLVDQLQQLLFVELNFVMGYHIRFVNVGQ